MTKQKACIIGYGRFGQVFEKMLEPGFEVSIIKRLTDEDAAAKISNAEFIFPCVPIRLFEEVITELVPMLKSGQTVADVCSVKLYPKKILEQHLPSGVNGVLTHPLFGPDSIKQESVHKVMMCPLNEPTPGYQTLKAFFNEKPFKLLEMSAEEHDREAAHSQAVTHFIGRSLDKAGLEPTYAITTVGYERLMAVKEQTCNDSAELFEDMLRFNPYAKEVLDGLIEAFGVIISA